MKLKGLDYVVLEYLAFWEQSLTANRLGEVFGVDRVHAQRAIVTPYKRRHPGRLETVGRGCRLGQPERPIYGPDNLEALFGVMEMMRVASGEGASGVRSERVEALVAPSGEGGFRHLYAASARREAVLLTYDGTDGTVSGRFSPHHLVRCASGAHYRGHLSPSGTRAGFYTDIDPNRIIRLEEGGTGAFIGAEGDSDWHAREDVGFRLADQLSPSVRAATKREYAGLEGVEEGRLLVRGVRRCLVPHLVRLLRYKILEEGPVEVWVPENG
jgi:hypothetical protein